MRWPEKRRADLRISLVRDGIVLNLKDGCAVFAPGDPAQNTGLRITAWSSGSVQYQNTFGLIIVTIVM